MTCCLVYSQISRAPLTWTLRDRMIPCWGISTQTSRWWIKFAGIPSCSFLVKKKENTGDLTKLSCQKKIQFTAPATAEHSIWRLPLCLFLKLMNSCIGNDLGMKLLAQERSSNYPLYVQWGLGMRECRDWLEPWTGSVSPLQNEHTRSY